MVNILQEFWIVEKKSGRCMFNKGYGSTTTDPDLLTSFLSALYRFSEEVSTRHKGIEGIEMGGLKWVYNDTDNLLYIAAADKNDDSSEIRSQVNVIRINFLKKFPACKNEDFHDKWDGNTSQYDIFASTVDELTEDWKKLEKVTNAAEMMDILGVYQQIFNLLAKILPSIKKGKEILDKKMISLKEVLPKSFHNITYSESGWDLLTINVFHLDIKENELREGLKTMLRFYLDVLDEFFRDKIYEIIRTLVFPYLRSDWSRISNLKLDKVFVNLFLI